MFKNYIMLHHAFPMSKNILRYYSFLWQAVLLDTRVLIFFSRF